MAERSVKSTAHWSDVKASLAGYDRDELLKLVQDLYMGSKDNQIFLHTRFGLGGDVLAPYKAIISRWLWPDVFKNLDTSVAKARKAVSDYRKATILRNLRSAPSHAGTDTVAKCPSTHEATSVPRAVSKDT